MNVETLIQKLSIKQNLTIEETKFLFRKIMNGELEDDKISKILLGLADKGETADEITGGASVLREKSLQVNINMDAIDMCGTGRGWKTYVKYIYCIFIGYG